MEKSVKKFVLYICLSICICMLYGCKDAEEKKESAKEWNFSEILGNQDFSVDATEVGTAAKGTVICYERNPNVIECSKFYCLYGSRVVECQAGMGI